MPEGVHEHAGPLPRPTGNFFSASPDRRPRHRHSRHQTGAPPRPPLPRPDRRSPVTGTSVTRPALPNHHFRHPTRVPRHRHLRHPPDAPPPPAPPSPAGTLLGNHTTISTTAPTSTAVPARKASAYPSVRATLEISPPVR